MARFYKSTVIFIVILGIFYLQGCDECSEIKLKKECVKFAEKGMSRHSNLLFQGTFYSKKKKTCISIYFGPVSIFYDELTNSVFDRGNYTAKEFLERIKGFDLVGHEGTSGLDPRAE